MFSIGQFLEESLVHNTRLQGVFSVKKASYFSVTGINFLDSIKSPSVEDLKITLLGNGVSE